MKRLFVLLLVLSSIALAGRHGGAHSVAHSGGRQYGSSSLHSHGAAHVGGIKGSPRSHSSASSGGSHLHGGRSHASLGTKSTHHRDPGYRVNRNVPQSTKNKLFKEAGIPKSERKNYVIDHKIALENGGTNDISNLQVQSKSAAKAKDKLENQEAASRRHSEGLTKGKKRKH